jgi:hypothetical protein
MPQRDLSFFYCGPTFATESIPIPHHKRRIFFSAHRRATRPAIHSRIREPIKNKKTTAPNNKVTKAPKACQGSRIMRRIAEIKVAKMNNTGGTTFHPLTAP